MAKKIKFNLKCNNQNIADLESLKENFNLEDIMVQFKNGRLQRWLDSHGLIGELEKVKAIQATDEKHIVKGLLEAFDIKISEQEEQQALLDICYEQEKNNFLQRITKAQTEQHAILEHYHQGFYTQIRGIIKNPTDRVLIKKNLDNIATDYYRLFLLYRVLFFQVLLRDAPLSLLMSFGIKKLREVWKIGLPKKKSVSDFVSRIVSVTSGMIGESSTQGDRSRERQNMDSPNEIAVSIPDEMEYEKGLFQNSMQTVIEQLLMLINNDEIITPLIEQKLIKKYDQNTEGYWRDLESQSTQCLILKMQGECQIDAMRENGEKAQGRGENEVNGQFVIFDGLRFQTPNHNSSSGYIIYLEL